MNLVLAIVTICLAGQPCQTVHARISPKLCKVGNARIEYSDPRVAGTQQASLRAVCGK